jgi:phosphate transport system protein
MSHRLQDSIEEIKRKVLSLGDQAEEMVDTAVKAIDTRNPEAAARVRHAEDLVDQAEVGVEEACLKAIALFQPVANDLRFLVAVLKINSDLERIADLAVDIAGEACKLAKGPLSELPFNLTDEVKTVREMLHTSLTALVRGDAEMAQRVCSQDRHVDQLHKGMYTHVERAMQNRVADVGVLVNMLNISRHLERIADHATNIAEDVIYLTRGNIVRHRPFQVDAA